MYTQARILSMHYSRIEHVVNLVCNTQVNILCFAESLNKPLANCVRTTCSKLSTSLEQLVTSLTGISDLLQGCPNNSDTDLL